MDEAEIDRRAREAYQVAREAGDAQIPWEDLPAFMREHWRALVLGDAGAAID